MNGYLVLGNCSMDNVPMGWFSDLSAAMDQARDLTPSDIVAMGLVVLKCGISEKNVVCTAVVPFQMGMPQPMVMVKDFTE